MLFVEDDQVVYKNYASNKKPFSKYLIKNINNKYLWHAL